MHDGQRVPVRVTHIGHIEIEALTVARRRSPIIGATVPLGKRVQVPNLGRAVGAGCAPSGLSEAPDVVRSGHLRGLRWHGIRERQLSLAATVGNPSICTAASISEWLRGVPVRASTRFPRASIGTTVNRLAKLTLFRRANLTPPFGVEIGA